MLIADLEITLFLVVSENAEGSTSILAARLSIGWRDLTRFSQLKDRGWDRARALLIAANDFVSFVGVSLARENYWIECHSREVRERFVVPPLRHFHRHDFRRTRSLISTRHLSLFLSFFLSIRCISFTSAPIFPLSFPSSRAIEGCRRISPLEGVRTGKKGTRKNVFLWRVARKRMATTFVALRHLPLFIEHVSTMLER